jgi:hypothetical protein
MPPLLLSLQLYLLVSPAAAVAVLLLGYGKMLPLLVYWPAGCSPNATTAAAISALPAGVLLLLVPRCCCNGKMLPLLVY